MSIATEVWSGFDPDEFYGPENQPPREVQNAFLRYALMETEDIDDPARFLKGPYAQNFTDILKDVNDGLSQINPSFTPEYLMPFGYRSPAVQLLCSELNSNERVRLERLQTKRDEQITNLAQNNIGPAIMNQVVPRGVLDEPAYRYQGQDWKDFESQRACANACFRMVFQGITGFDVREDVVANNMRRSHGHSLVADSEYRKILATDVFTEVSDKHVQVIDLMGADIKSIGTIAMRIKQRNSDAKVFSVITLGSARASKDVWHQCVLLGATAKGIICNDPAAIDKMPARILPHEKFAERWAIAHNRAQIFIST